MYAVLRILIVLPLVLPQKISPRVMPSLKSAIVAGAGDSIAGSGHGSSFMGLYVTSALFLRNQATSGAKCSDIGVGQSNDEMTTFSAPAFNIFILVCGTNDIGNGASAAKALADYSALIDVAVSRGQRPIGLTTPPARGGAGWTDPLLVKHDAFDAALAAPGTSACTGLPVDATDPRVDTAAEIAAICSSLATNLSCGGKAVDIFTLLKNGSGGWAVAGDTDDNVHLTTQGAQKVADLLISSCGVL